MLSERDAYTRWVRPVVVFFRAALRLHQRCRRCDERLPKNAQSKSQLCRPCWLRIRGGSGPQNHMVGVWYGGDIHPGFGKITFPDPLHGHPICVHCGAIINGSPSGGEGHGSKPGEQCTSWENTGNCLECGGFIHSECASECPAPGVAKDTHDWTPLGPYSAPIDPPRYYDHGYAWKCRRCYRYAKGAYPPCNKKHRWHSLLRSGDGFCLRCGVDYHVTYHYGFLEKYDDCSTNPHEWVSPKMFGTSKHCRWCLRLYADHLRVPRKRCTYEDSDRAYWRIRGR